MQLSTITDTDFEEFERALADQLSEPTLTRLTRLTRARSKVDDDDPRYGRRSQARVQSRRPAELRASHQHPAPERDLQWRFCSEVLEHKQFADYRRYLNSGSPSSS